jgi:hypothetical protein
MEKWNYKLPIPQPMWDAQTDWNQTLMTKFNMLAVGINEEIIIKVPNKFKPLIDSLEFYDNTNSSIGNKYIVEFFESNDNIINVGDKELEVENF